ncbi:hypothetical protein JCM11641_008307 [Rhodosporidiobolus odoratus]
MATRKETSAQLERSLLTPPPPYPGAADLDELQGHEHADLEVFTVQIIRDMPTIEKLERDMPEETARFELLQHTLKALEANRFRLFLYRVFGTPSAEAKMTVEHTLQGTGQIKEEAEAKKGGRSSLPGAESNNHNLRAHLFAIDCRLSNLQSLQRDLQRCKSYEQIANRWGAPRPSTPIGVHTDSEDDEHHENLQKWARGH